MKTRAMWIRYLKEPFNAFIEDDCLTLGASVAYFSVFSLAPLLLVVISVAGLVFGREAVQHNVQGQVEGLIGADAAHQIQTMLENANANRSGGIVGAVIGVLVLLFGATGAFVSLQDALNKTWHVMPDPKRGGVLAFLSKRILSFGLVMGIAFLLLVSLAVSATLAALATWFQPMLPGVLSGPVLRGINVLVSAVVIAALFAGMFRYLPDARIEWRDTWVGAALTSVLFTAGKTAIGIYLGKSGAASAYGAAGSLVLIILWLYYASLIFLFGAEFTRSWAEGHGRPVRPEHGAVRVITEERHEPGAGAPEGARP